MSDPSPKRKGRSSGPAPESPAQVSPPEAGDTLILRSSEASERLRVAREDLVSPSEATVVLRSGEGAGRALEQGGPAPGSVDPDATARLARKDLVSPHEGTVLMPAVPALAQEPAQPLRSRSGEPDTVPGLAPEVPSPSDRTELVPVREMLSEVLGGPADRTLVLRAGEPPPPVEGAEEAAAHEGTMLMPAVVPPPPAPVAEDTRPDLVPPAVPGALGSEPAPEAAPEAPVPSAPDPGPPSGAGEATVVTAADIIRQTFAEEPDAASRTIKVTQGSLPELRMPDLPEFAPAPEPAPPDQEPGRSTLHMRIQDMPETRALPERHPGLFPPAPPADLGPPAAFEAPPPAPAPEAPPRSAETAPVQAPQAAKAAAAPQAPPARGASLGLWVAVIAGIAVVGGGLWAWNLGWFDGAEPDRPAGPGAKAPQTPPADPAAAVPEQMRPAYEKALAGDPNAMRYLGVCYVNGLGVPADRAEGLKWYRRAAAAGSAAAQRDLQALEAQGIR